MSQTAQASPIPTPILVVFRGIGQVFFQENALTGALFLLGIAIAMPIQAVGALLGAAIGTAVAKALKFDEGEWTAGIFGFNSTLVGIATLFFFQLSAMSVVLLVVGCIIATLLTKLMRTSIPFPTYTTPFIVTTWVIFFLAPTLGCERVVAAESDSATETTARSVPFVVEAAVNGVGQVMFQAGLITGLLFLIAIAINDRWHASLVLVGSIVGMLLASYHLTGAMKSLDPERLIERSQFENVALGLYGYNAALAAVSVFLWRKSLLLSLLGMILTEPLTELVPTLGLPALTAPFVLASWIVIAIGTIEQKLFGEKSS
jgi:urea transporter